MIECRLNGRMGNQMFQYVVSRLIAEKRGFNFYVPRIGDSSIPPSTEGHHLSLFFPNIDLGIKDGELMYNFSEDHTIQKYNPDIFNAPDYTLISGFFQTDLYFDGYEDKVKSWFKIEMDSVTSDILKLYDTERYCYIHIRATDYKNHSHWMLNKEYYINAISKIRDIKKDMSFVIISDDIETSKDMFPDIDVVSNDMMVDFKLLYYSKYCIISNSTFAWWAAWLSNKELTIAPNNWLNYNKSQLGFYPVDVKSKKFTYV